MSGCDETKTNDTAMKNEDDTKQKDATVPLSLSSLAHIMCLPRSEENLGVLEGLLSVVHHTLSEVSNHSSAPIQATPWILEKCTQETDVKDLPYCHVKHSYLYEGSVPPKLAENHENWASSCDAQVVGRISLYYASSQDKLTEDDDEDMQQALLTKAVVEYRSQPSRLSEKARKQEELSLTSFGNGSVDDNVKLGALSSLHDSSGKYVLKITSIRNKTYQYDVSDNATGVACVTVTNEQDTKGPPLVRLEFLLSSTVDQDEEVKLRPLSFPSSQLEQHFLVWDTPANATALPSRQTLLLKKQGMYINGRLLASNTELAPPIFGFNLDGVPAWHGRIQDYQVVKQAYATLWQEIMIDARLGSLNIASLLLERLMNGVEDEDDDDEDTTNMECLESQLMASSKYDPVGICAKALATRFAQEFGKNSVPCLAHEVEWFQHRMGHKTPVVVPQRVINVLRRGGYFDLQRDTNETWFMENVSSASEGEQAKAVEEALGLLKEAGCDDTPKIMFVKLNGIADPVKHKAMCRYNDALVQYHVNDAVWNLDNPAKAIALYVGQEFPDGNVLLNLMSK